MEQQLQVEICIERAVHNFPCLYAGSILESMLCASDSCCKFVEGNREYHSQESFKGRKNLASVNNHSKQTEG